MPLANRYKCFSSSVPCSPRIDIFLMWSRGVILQGDSSSFSVVKNWISRSKDKNKTLGNVRNGAGYVNYFSDKQAVLLPVTAVPFNACGLYGCHIETFYFQDNANCCCKFMLSCSVSLGLTMQEESGCWEISTAEKDMSKPKSFACSPWCIPVAENSTALRKADIFGFNLGIVILGIPIYYKLNETARKKW